MLLEELLALPIGTHVYGDIATAATLPGVIESCQDRFRMIRWADGFVTVPLGLVRDFDEYIAAHTRLAGSRHERRQLDADPRNPSAGECVQSLTAA
jgi:hypothetical protein